MTARGCTTAATERRLDRLHRLIAGRLARDGVPPTLVEIGAALGIKSKGHVNRLMGFLEDRGQIERLPARARAVRVLVWPAPQYFITERRAGEAVLVPLETRGPNPARGEAISPASPRPEICAGSCPRPGDRGPQHGADDPCGTSSLLLPTAPGASASGGFSGGEG